MYNNEFEIINAEDKAYVLGLFYADGNVSLRQRHCRIQLKASDGALLYEIQRKFPFFRLYHVKRGSNDKPNSEDSKVLYCGDKRFKQHLMNLGCVPQKSTYNKDCLSVPNIGKEFVWDFIRGYFDGNGSCTNTGRTGIKLQRRVKIYSSSKPLLNSINNVLQEDAIKATINCTNTSHGTLIYWLTIRTSSYALFYTLLYKGKLFLERKKVTYDRMLLTPVFTAAPLTKCKHCGEVGCVKDGLYTYKTKRQQRYLCRICNNRFYLPIEDSNTSIVLV